jgi:hypothetical protein
MTHRSSAKFSARSFSASTLAALAVLLARLALLAWAAALLVTPDPPALQARRVRLVVRLALLEQLDRLDKLVRKVRKRLLDFLVRLAPAARPVPRLSLVRQLVRQARKERRLAQSATRAPRGVLARPARAPARWDRKVPMEPLD